MMAMAPPRASAIRLPKYVYSTVSRGRRYWFYWYKRGQVDQGKRITLPDPETGLEFWSAYNAAVAASCGPAEPKAGTFSALISIYKSSQKWHKLSPANQKNWAHLLGIIDKHWGDLPVADLTAPPIQALIDGMASTPAKANNLRRCLSAMIKWSIPRGWRSDNPCRHLESIEGGEAYSAWPREAIETARQKLPRELWWGAALAYFTGQRKGDCLRMRWADAATGRIILTQEKTGKPLSIPIHRDLAVILGQIPKRGPFILTGKKGAPWTKNGFTATWQKIVNGAPRRPNVSAYPGIPELQPYVFHGLRKSSVVALLEAGCTTSEVASITGQSLKMVEHYARDVDRKKLATAAILKWEQNG